MRSLIAAGGTAKGRRLLVPGVLAAFLASCGGGPQREAVADPSGSPSSAPTSAVPSIAATADSTQRNAFALIHEGDTVAIERYTRTPAGIEGEIRNAGDGTRLAYTAAIGADARPSRLDLSLYGSGATQPMTRVRIELTGTSLVAEQQKGTAVSLDTVAVPAGTFVYFNPSIALLEQMLRRSRVIGGDRVELSVFTIATGENASLETPTISWIRPDSVEVVRRGNRIRLRTGASGQITSGANSSDIEIRRLP